MKKILGFIGALIIWVLEIFRSAIDFVIYHLFITREYFSGNECKRLKDCRLLFRLKKTQPPASDRFIEFPWMLENISMQKGKLLDVGSTISDNLYETLPKTIEINTLNLNQQKIKSSKIKFKLGDIRKTDYPDDHFDCITCISTLEHIGVSGRYGSDEDPEGDLRATREMKRILKPKGTLLVTIPYGIKDVLPINKLYNKQRVKKLFVGFKITDQTFIKFNKSWNAWLKVTEAQAAKTDMLNDGWYAIALIKATKK